MQLLWFYIAIVLSLSDEIHTRILWGLFLDFYILLAGIIQKIVGSNIRMWIIHEFFEFIFHLVLLSLLFLSVEIGMLAATIHLVVDVYHELASLNLNALQHRALHFTLEALFFIILTIVGII